MAGAIEVAKLVTRLVTDSTEFNRGMQDSIKTATGWGEKIRSALSTAVVTKGLSLLGNAARGAASSLVGLAKSGAGLPGIANAFNRNAQQLGVSLEAMQKAAGGTISDMELMRNANIALTGAGQMLGQEFGKSLPALLEGARAAAAATGQSTDFLFTSLVTGVKRASPMLIDNTGIVLKLGEANQALANKLGKSVDKLTAEEKSIAILNATVEASQRLVAQTGGAGLTTAEKIAGLGVVMQNFRDQVSTGLNPVLGQATGILLNLANMVLPVVQDVIVNRVAPAISIVLDLVENWIGAFNGAHSSVKAFTSYFADEFGNIQSTVETVSETSVQKFSSKMATFAERALTWGIQIATDFASGLIQGAAAALTQAMQFIGNLLSSWLAPSSPPKIMPNLDKWAQSSMNLYLHNMTQADFGILEGMQGPISTALSRLVDAGKMDPTKSAKMFSGLSEGLAKAMATGEDPTDLFKRLEKATGAYGADIAELAKRQFKLAAATKAVKDAEEALEGARAAQKDAQDNVSKLADEYNKLLAAGASEEVLAAKRKEFAEAEKALDLADDQALAAEEQKTEAEKILDPLQEQVALQQKVLDQMFKMTEPMSAMTDALTAAIGKLAGGADGLMPELPAPTFNTEGIATSLGNAFENAKTAISEKLTGLFQPVVDEWTKLKEGPLAELQSTWETFTTTVRQFWDEKITPIIEKIKELIPPDAVTKLGEFAGKFLVAAAAGGILFGILSILLNPVTLLIAGIAAIVLFGGQAAQMFRDLQSLAMTLAGALGEYLGVKLDEITGKVRDDLLGAWEALNTFVEETLKPAWADFKDNYLQPLINGVVSLWDGLKEATTWFGNLAAKIKELGGRVMDALKLFIGKSPSPLEKGLRGISSAMKDMARFDIPSFGTAIDTLAPSPMMGVAGAGSSNTNYNYTMEVNARNVEQNRTLLDWEQFRFLSRR